MEMQEIKNLNTEEKTVLEFKKEISYGDDRNNYILPKEITVTITLNEYRELVEKTSIANYKLEELKQEKNKNIEELKKEVEKLKNKILQCELDEEK